MSAPAVLAFDVNETLLDLAALDPLFDETLGDSSLRPAWFASMLQLSFVEGLTGRYTDYTGLQRAALRMTAARQGLEVDDAVVDRVVAGMRRLPPHRDVPGALDRLASGGPRLVALTNSPPDVAREQIDTAGLTPHLDLVLSADDVRALKPAAAPYLMAAERCGVAVGDVALVAAHAWDVSGALAAGCRAVLVGRGGAVPSPLGPRPELVVPDLTGVADAFASA